MPMTPLTSEREKKHNDSDKYFICQKKFNNNLQVNITKIFKK